MLVDRDGPCLDLRTGRGVVWWNAALETMTVLYPLTRARAVGNWARDLSAPTAMKLRAGVRNNGYDV